MKFLQKQITTKNKLVILTFVLFSGLNQVYAQRLDLFATVTGSIKNKYSQAKIAFPEIKTYYGYLQDSHKLFVAKTTLVSIYFSLEMDVSEIGIRVISPVPEEVFPNKRELVSELYQLNNADHSIYFDPAIKLFKASKIDKEELKKQGGSWSLFAENDNSAELPGLPSGKKNNALIRQYDKNNPDSLVFKKGFYRIDVRSVDSSLTSGSFLLQVGSTSEIPVIRISESIDGL